MDFYICEKCGNIITFAEGVHGKHLTCCGEDMKELVAGTSDGAAEKHVPKVTVNGKTVTVEVGSVLHPADADHWIMFVALETNLGCQIQKHTSSEKPVFTFALADGETPKAAYEYCNKHGLWKADI